jgi:hypothetical protein
MMAGVRNLIVMTVVLGLLAGCWAVSPQLDPHDPPPNVPDGWLLLEIPEGVIEALGDASVLADRDRALLYHDATRAELIRSHQLVTGMSAQEVIWVFGSHPTRVRDQGPPGGHTMLWVLPRGLGFGQATVAVLEDGTGRGNYWVRLDGRGLVVAAGRN